MNTRRQKLIDGSAMGLSLLCLFHCLAMPFVVSVVPLLGVHLFEESTIHLAFLALALPLSLFGLWLGVKGAHGGARLMAIAGVGLALMFLGTFHEVVGELDVALTSVGVSFVALAHFLNWRRHERAHHHMPHDHLVQHSHDPCPCEVEGLVSATDSSSDTDTSRSCHQQDRPCPKGLEGPAETRSETPEGQAPEREPLVSTG